MIALNDGFPQTVEIWRHDGVTRFIAFTVGVKASHHLGRFGALYPTIQRATKTGKSPHPG